jgi:hypothetical protein
LISNTFRSYQSDYRGSLPGVDGSVQLLVNTTITGQEREGYIARLTLFFGDLIGTPSCKKADLNISPRALASYLGSGFTLYTIHHPFAGMFDDGSVPIVEIRAKEMRELGKNGPALDVSITSNPANDMVVQIELTEKP